MCEFLVELHPCNLADLKDSFESGPIIELFADGSEEVEFEKVTIGRFNGLKVEVFSREHPPPHFRIRLNELTANFTIGDCKWLNGNKELFRYRKNVFKWWRENKQLLIDYWNDNRPSDCPVGPYRE